MNRLVQRKKLIEVALPLDAINKASAREKSIRHGHPSTLHLWWARRPLAAARAVIFAQMVDDPSSWPEVFPTEAEQEKKRQRLFRLIEELVQWENTTNEGLLEQAREEIRLSWRRTCAENQDHPRAGELFDPERLPAFHDPFAGGGTLPLEAQRLGLEAHASDLNPVAVLINKAMIEIPPKFAGMSPVNPEWRAKAKDNPLEAQRQWKGAQGLAEDVRYYGKWMCDEAEKRIGHLYPKVEVTAEMAKERPDLERYVGRELTVIAWLWARTVKSPNPAFRDVDVPLASTFMLSTKKGKEAYVEPVIEGHGYRFKVKVPGSAGVPPAQGDGASTNAGVSPASGTKLGRGANFRCLMSGTPIAGDYIKAEGKAGRMSARLMAIVAEGDRRRVYLAPTPEHEKCAREANPEWRPAGDIPARLTGGTCVPYGLTIWGDLFTPRQLVALTTFSDLVTEAIAQVRQDILGARVSCPHKSWHSRGYLPHLDQPDLIQFVTFRLLDSIPAKVVTTWKEELALTGGEPADDSRCVELRERIERYSDEGHGECWLFDERIAQQVENTLRHFDGTRYRLLEWVIMPNHVHVLIETLSGFPLDGVLQSWKSFTAKRANKMLGRTGPFWMRDYFDRYIRDEKHLAAVREYIQQNPVKARLVQSAGDWRWGSASGKGAGGTPTLPVGDLPLRDSGTGAIAYAEAIAVFVSLGVSKLSDAQSSMCRWKATMDQSIATFGRQALPMVWDYSEANIFGRMAGDLITSVKNMMRVVDRLPTSTNHVNCRVDQAGAQSQTWSTDRVVSTDPPYYDNIGYADLSDFFHVWLRRSLQPIFPDLFATLTVPKAEELIASPHRHGGKDAAEKFFLGGMTQAMHCLAQQTHISFPITIYYAFKQAESARGMNAGGTPALPGIRTGWETFLDAVIHSGFAITGTWPMRTELSNRMIGKDSNALASSIVLVCRKRPEDAPLATRRQFIDSLKSELPAALAHLQSGSIAPVDLAQAAIGPGMAVYTRYAKVVDSTGNPVTVREALALINETLDEVLSTQEGDFDADTRWALAWFEQHGFEDGDYGVAETLSKAKNTSVFSLKIIGVLRSKGGKVRLLMPLYLRPDWDPRTAGRVSAWLSLHHLIRIHNAGGEQAAAAFVRKLGGLAETARELAYRLYALAERTKRSREALWYNALVQSWPEIARLARQEVSEQTEMLATLDGEQEG